MKESYIKNTKSYFFIRKQYYRLIRLLFNINKLYRVYFSNEKYNRLKELKNKYLNERCFIVATGPSLRIDDLERLKKEYCFGMNSIASLYNQTNWRPTFFGCQDPTVYKQLKREIEACTYIYKLYGSFLGWYQKLPNDCIKFPLDLMNHPYDFIHYDTKFSDCCDIVVYDGYTITYSLIQIAIYMGFKEIYLLGTDCDYNGKKKHVAEYKDFFVANKETITERLIYAYSVADKYAKQHNIKIYNATRGGKLEIFERVDFDKLKLKGE